MDLTGMIEISGIYLVHDENRVDRWNILRKELLDFFKHNELVTIMPAVKGDWPAHTCIYRAHRACVQRASDRKYPYAIVLEDDWRAHEGARGHIEEALKNVPDDWEVLTTGIYSGETTPLKEYPLWHSVKDFSGGHFYIVRDTAYERFLAFDGSNHFDRAITSTMKLKAYVVWPFAVTQHPTYSDNIKEDKNYDHLLKKYECLPIKQIVRE